MFKSIWSGFCCCLTPQEEEKFPSRNAFKIFEERLEKAKDELQIISDDDNANTMDCPDGLENIRDLHKVFDKLMLLKQKMAIQNTVDSGEDSNNDDYYFIKKWISKVENVEDEVAKIDCDYAQQCLPYTVINKWAAKAAEDVRNLFDLDNLQPKCAYILTQTARSIGLYARQASDYLEDDEVKVVGMWGTGGVGKTAILQLINSRSCFLGFDYLIWVVASQEPNLHRLQADIAKRVGLTLDSTESLETNAELLCRFLERKKFLFLLDDMREPLDLTKLGVPCPSTNGKVVFTTRSETVCDEVIANTESFHCVRCRKIKVECLNRTDAWDTFSKNLDYKFSNRIEKICAKEVVEKCGGLPLALVVIARSIAAKKISLDVQEWKDVVNYLDKASKMQSDETYMNSLLKISYNLLPDDIIKNCFLCAALWPKDYEIEESELISCWLGMNLIDGSDDIITAYKKGHSIYEYLEDIQLLNTSRDNTNLHGSITTTKVHDMIKGLAQWILSDCEETNKKWMVVNGDQIKGGLVDLTKWGEAEVISLVKGRLETVLPEHIPDCSKLFTLMLQKNSLCCIPEGFFQNMHAVTYLDLSSNQFSDIPQAIYSLLQLQFLNLSHNPISMLPMELAILTKLKYLILRHTMKLRSIAQGLIMALRKLNMLDLFNSGYDGWGREREARIEEVLRCSKTRILGMDISRPYILEQLLKNPCIFIHWLNVKHFEGVTTFLLSQLLLKNGNTQRALRMLIFEDCDGLEEIKVDSINSQDGCESLEELMLYNLPNFKKISLAEPWILRNVRVLIIEGCNKLKNITWILPLRLTTLEVSYCNAMEQVIGNAEVDENSNCLFLEYLKLCYLPLLSSFSTREHIYVRCKKLDIYMCPKLSETRGLYVQEDF